MNSIIQFTQGSLQDYADCPRRYQLRYLLVHPWPPLLSASPQEAELRLKRGAAFHHIMHQHYAGVAPSHLAAAVAGDPVLRRWWEAFLLHPPPEIPSTYLRPEAVVAAPLADHRLVARLDLLAVDPGARAVVVDWKTSMKRPTRSELAKRLQTRVYLYLLTRAMWHVEGQPSLGPAQTEMVYWFCDFGGVSEHFRYSPEQLAADEAYLVAMAGEIANRKETVWPLTPYEDRCSYCSYRSLCERRAGPALETDDADGDIESEIDIEQIAEVAF
jgi:hypothetical protein